MVAWWQSCGRRRCVHTTVALGVLRVARVFIIVVDWAFSWSWGLHCGSGQPVPCLESVTILRRSAVVHVVIVVVRLPRA